MRLAIDDRVLLDAARPVAVGDRFRLARLERAMLALVRDLGGAGLAAPRCGLSVQAFVVGLGPGHAPFNPAVTARSAKVEHAPEGCLSLPVDRMTVPRSTWVDVAWTDLHGRRSSARAEGFPARVIQREADHLDGLLVSRFPPVPDVRP